MGKIKCILPIAVIAFLFLKTIAVSQTFPAGADSVVKFTPGIGIPHGNSPTFFPQNVLGLPSKDAREFTAETREEEICALNFGGEIIIGFKNALIVNAPGPDFTIFENAFKSPIAPYIFAEPAKIAVSRDGVIFKEFPFDSLTLKGCAGITPTFGNKNPFDPAESGGESFDLADIGMDSVRFIKITDITGELLKPGHPFFQPVLTGFDLDAVVGLHCVVINTLPIAKPQIVIFKNASELVFKSGGVLKETACEIFSIEGKSFFKNTLVNDFSLPLKILPTGAYLIVIKNIDGQFTQKIIIE